MAMLAASRRDTKVDRLARHPLLRGCSPVALRRLAAVLDEVRVPAGGTLVEAGPLARWFFFVDAGEVELVDGAGVVGALGPGDSFGHASLRLRDRQATTAIARTNVSAFAAGGRDLLGLIAQLDALRSGPLGAFVPAAAAPRPTPPTIAVRAAPRPARPRPPVKLRPAPVFSLPTPVPRRRSRRPWLIALALAAGVLAAAAQYHPAVLLLRPGPVVDITDDVTIGGVAVHHPSGRYLLTTVRATRPTLLRLGLRGFGGPVDVVRLDQHAGSQAQLRRRGREEFETSRRNAAAAAAKASGVFGPLEVGFVHRDIVGPSAGLVYALLVSDMLGPGDLSAGRVVAATGTIDSGGTVGIVGGVVEKAAGLRHAGGALLLLPIDQLAGAGGLGISVIGVGSLADALKALRATS